MARTIATLFVSCNSFREVCECFLIENENVESKMCVGMSGIGPGFMSETEEKLRDLERMSELTDQDGEWRTGDFWWQATMSFVCSRPDGARRVLRLDRAVGGAARSAPDGRGACSARGASRNACGQQPGELSCIDM